MGDTSVRLSDEAKTRLDLSKRDGESYDDVILRLTETTWSGFGVLADESGSTRDGMARIREKVASGMADEIEDSGLDE